MIRCSIIKGYHIMMEITRELDPVTMETVSEFDIELEMKDEKSKED